MSLLLLCQNFGLRYLRANYLRQFPIDALKIDRSFVGGLGDDETSEAIVRAIASLAHTLGMRTVAEGIEHEGQIQPLRDAACDYGQGYFFSRPMPPTEVERYLGVARDKRRGGATCPP